MIKAGSLDSKESARNAGDLQSLGWEYPLEKRMATHSTVLAWKIGSDSKEYACNAGDLGSILGLGISSGEKNGYPLYCSGLENSMNRGAWQAIVHRVAKNRTRLSDFHFLSFFL